MITFKDPIIYALVLDTIELKTGRGEPYWKLNCITQYGEMSFKIWDCGDKPTENPNLPQKNQYLKLVINDETKAIKELKDQKSITIQGGRGSPLSWTFINKIKIPNDIKLVLKEASKEELNKAWSLINNSEIWEDQDNYKFVMSILQSLDQNLLKRCPAAKTMHHNYPGGLLIHISEVLKGCMAKAATFSNNTFLNKDVLYAAAILHDLGKIETFSCDEVNRPDNNPKERIHCHTMYSCYFLLKFRDQFEFKNNDFIDEVLHCIEAHHGKPEYGAFVIPQTIEAFYLHNADNESAKTDTLIEAMQSSKEENGFIKISYNEKMYVTSKMKNANSN
jgi:23S rRNA maturation-related 3'-5' exoribonuclease YhaM